MKLALITGGFRRIGATIAARLAADGWTLALHGRSNLTPEPMLAAILGAHETRWQSFAADLANRDSAEQLMAAVIAEFGQAPDLLVNNASHFAQDDWQSVDAAALSDRMATNFATPVLLCLAMAKALAGADGAIVNILDQRIKQPNADQLSYTLSKQALAGATETLARVLAPTIRVNAVAPGLTIPTDDYRPAQMVALEQAMPLKRLPEPDDIADAVLWLATARATTAQTIFVDGGAAMKSFERDFMFLG